MNYNLSDINSSIEADAKGFILACDAEYHKKIVTASDKILDNMKNSPIVLLSGPSGSGKTTTAKKIEEELETRGVKTYTVSLDHYFRTVDPSTAPRTTTGDIDFESPDCIDTTLLKRHFEQLSGGIEILVPHFSFSLQERSSSRFERIRLQKNEVIIFEGIHALNDEITNSHTHPFKLYISARSNILDGERTCFKGTWLRLVRRVVRDSLFRATEPAFTLGMWANIRLGEKRHISPYKNKAHYLFDTALPYEVSVMKNFAQSIFSDIPPDVMRYRELKQILPSFEDFLSVDPELVPDNSLLREFIGGGIYKY